MLQLILHSRKPHMSNSEILCSLTRHQPTCENDPSGTDLWQQVSGSNSLWIVDCGQGMSGLFLFNVKGEADTRETGTILIPRLSS
jgi:hypothetical protein